jgi:hypothetical protein
LTTCIRRLTLLAQKVRETLQLDLLELDLRALADNLPGDLTTRLRNEDDALKAIYELRIGAGFARLGMQVQWTSAADSGRRPEFVVNPSSAVPVSVECKKRDVQDGYEKDANRFFQHFQFLLRQRMEAQSLNYAMKLTAEQFKLGDVEGVSRRSSKRSQCEISAYSRQKTAIWSNLGSWPNRATASPTQYCGYFRVGFTA